MINATMENSNVKLTASHPAYKQFLHLNFPNKFALNATVHLVVLIPMGMKVLAPL